MIEALYKLIDWEMDCLVNKDFEKADKIEKIYKKMFDRQFYYYGFQSIL